MFRLAIFLAITCICSPALSFEAQTVDRFQFHPDGNNLPWSILIDEDDQIFVVGVSKGHMIVRQSSNEGKSWKTIETYGGQGIPFPNVTMGNFYTMKQNSQKDIFATGSLTSKSDGRSLIGWVVRKGANSGAEWSNSDLFFLAPGRPSQAAGLGIGADGKTVFASGVAADAAGVNHWIVRRSLDSGQSWQTVDDLPAGDLNSGEHNSFTIASDVIALSNGWILVSGWWASASGQTLE